MIIKKILEKLESSDEFKNWGGKDNYQLTSFFTTDNIDWQIGYYNKETDKIISFGVSDKVIKNEESEVFKKSGGVKELNLAKVKIDYEEAVNRVEEFRKENYSGDLPTKKVVILQNIEDGQVWNITLITMSLKTINVKVDSLTGKIISEEVLNLTDILKVDKGTLPTAK